MVCMPPPLSITAGDEEGEAVRVPLALTAAARLLVRVRVAVALREGDGCCAAAVPVLLEELDELDVAVAVALPVPLGVGSCGKDATVLLALPVRLRVLLPVLVRVPDAVGEAAGAEVPLALASGLGSIGAASSDGVTLPEAERVGERVALAARLGEPVRDALDDAAAGGA